jgi:uroporphyrinogen-III synthase
MTDTPLHGVGVLVTRPRAQAAELIKAIEDNGGNAVCFPVIEIVARDEAEIVAELAAIPTPDITIFVSQNAVAHGLRFAHGTMKAATGPATAAAIRNAGGSVDIQSPDGYDSESLLMQTALTDVAGKEVCIIRGNDGRELLAETLRERGATVNYLSVYDRRPPQLSTDALADVETAWRDGRIDAVTVMSVESLNNLANLLPEWCTQQMKNVPLVTPAARVIKEALNRYPASTLVKAAGPQAADMVDAIITTFQTGPTS